MQAVVDAVGNLLGAAVDTTGTTLHWLLYDLACHPDKQEILARELHDAFGGGDFDPSVHTPEYLKACYRESQRYSPIGPGGGMRTCPRDLALNGYNVPKGTLILMNTNAIQND